MRYLIFALALLLASCWPPAASHPQSAPPPQIVKVPVPQPCAGPRPAPVTSLKARTPNWSEMDVRQKAAATGQWALELQGYGQKLDAATAGCP